MGVLVSNLNEDRKAAARIVNGNLYVAVAKERLQRVAETAPAIYVGGDAGIQPPQWTPSLAQSSGGSLAETSTYGYRCTFYSKTFFVESDPTAATSITLTGSNQTVTITADSWLAPIENSVTHVRVYRTLKNPAFTDVAGGIFYRVAEVEIGTFEAVGFADTQSDGSIGVATNRVSFVNDTPPDAYALAFFGNRLWFAGQEEYTLLVDMTNDSTSVTLNSSETDIFRKGIRGRAVYVKGDNVLYSVTAWVDVSTITLNEAYEGPDETGATLVVRSAGSEIRYSGVVTTPTLPGVPLPEISPATNVVLFDRDDGYNITGLIETQEALYAFKDTKWGYTTSPGVNVRKVEDIGTYVNSDRNLTILPDGSIAFIREDGLGLIGGVQPSVNIAELVRDLWVPLPSTTTYWTRTELKNAILIAHPRFNWLVMIGATNGNTNKDHILVYDWEAQAFYQFSLYGDGNGTAVSSVDITAALVIDVNGQDELLLAGKMTVSATVHVSRILRTETGLVDEVPDDQIAATDHGIQWNAIFPPVLTENDDVVKIERAEGSWEPRSGSAGTVTFALVFDDADEQDVAVTGSQTQPLDEPRFDVVMPPNLGRRMSLKISGEVDAAEDEVELRRLKTTWSAHGGGGRGS